MCGRYILNPEVNPELNQLLMKLSVQGISVKTGEVFPTDQVLILRKNAQGKMVVDAIKWGFDSLNHERKHINARAETVLEKPTSREAFLKQRCVFLTTGFYEWNPQKEKILFRKSDSEILYLAGIFEQEGGAILTTSANASMEKTHDRMPVILDKESIEAWLSDVRFAANFLTQSAPELSQETVEKAADSTFDRQIDLFSED